MLDMNGAMYKVTDQSETIWRTHECLTSQGGI